LLLRKVDNRRWDWVANDFPWLQGGQFPAAPLADLRTSVKCALSVWQIEDNQSNLDVVLAALAAGLENCDKIDFTLFDPTVLAQLGIGIVSAPGDSKDNQANGLWHRHLVELSAEKLIELAKKLHVEAVFNRRDEDEVRGLIQSSIGANRIDLLALDERLRNDLGP
jgi:hypothetical protein